MEGSQSGNRARYQKGKVYIETIEKLKDFTMKDDLSEKDIDKLDADLKEQLKQITIARIRTVSSDKKYHLDQKTILLKSWLIMSKKVIKLAKIWCK